ncbi:Protein-disulfide isomerase [Thiohalospira halophila DSM 15071]|uniref:Thiol:disulfide interchange protein n=1 Tax=Thiohalospira halophila DSM 15071 TaxID=1123397 RepID=A0A1I1MZB6_9GAMM|nr:DsbC family protein [Thiohalospira halophila]SFC90727.1 Protein-disulfide isomerase [Thiohalospira halophila DSM 15071]
MNKKLVQGVSLGLVAGAVAGVLVAKNAGPMGQWVPASGAGTADSAASSPAPQDGAAPTNPGALPAVFEGVDIGKDQVIAEFETAVPQLRGYILQRAENRVPMAVYVTPDRKHMIAGAMIDENGDSMTAQHYQRHSGYTKDELAALANNQGSSDKGGSPAGSTEEVLAGLKDATLVTQGSGGAEMYVLMDVDCPYCKRLYHTVSSLRDEVTVNWVMVGYRGPRAQQTAAKILGHDDPASALDQVMADRQALADYEGATAMEAVEENTEAAQKLGLRGTPHGVVLPADGGEAQRLRGAAPESRLRQMMGL